MALTRWLIDKSALVKMSASSDRDLWSNRIRRGLIGIASVTLLELGFSARNGKEARSSLMTPPLSLLPQEFMTPAIERRAQEVQLLMADQGRHRAPSIPDLLIAAVAELTNRVVLHDDKDFDLIATITGQPMERLHTRR